MTSFLIARIVPRLPPHETSGAAIPLWHAREKRYYFNGENDVGVRMRVS